MNNYKTILVCLIAAFGFSQVPSFTVVYLDAKPFQQDEIAEKFDAHYKDVEFNSGGLYLEKLNGGNTLGTHRVVFFGDATNWGMKEGQKEKNENNVFWRNVNDHVESWGDAFSGRILDYDGDVAPDHYGYIQIYDIAVNNPEKFLNAHKKMVSQARGLMEDRPVAFGTYDIGSPNGATHWVAVGYKDVGDNIVIKSKMEQELAKEWGEYFKNRGEVINSGNFDLKILRTYGSFN
ncbi:MAG: hypothetical protein O2961_06450 [Bacteroidetes bacterium]|nr:hypothetical protein [Bacteroidota bacterium]MDA0889238.1 hypothetical protein [Bacteroidota bacterium]